MLSVWSKTPACFTRQTYPTGDTFSYCGLGPSERLLALRSVGFRGRAVPPVWVPGPLGGDGARGRTGRGGAAVAAPRVTVWPCAGTARCWVPARRSLRTFLAAAASGKHRRRQNRRSCRKSFALFGIYQLDSELRARFLCSHPYWGQLGIPRTRHAVKQFKADLTEHSLSTYTCFPSHRCRRE